MKVTIASYSRPKTIRPLIIVLVVVIFVVGTTLRISDGTITPAPSSLKFGFEMEVIAWICGLLGLLITGVVLWQLIMEKGAAIWVENGRIVYLHRWYQSADEKDVEDVSSDNSGASDKPVIVLRLRHGRKMEIRSDLLSEPGEVIVSRLKQNLSRT